MAVTRSIVAARVVVTEWCVCGATYGSLSTFDPKIRKAWDAVHDEHARFDRYTDEEKD